MLGEPGKPVGLIPGKKPGGKLPLLNGIASIWNAPKYSVGRSPGGIDGNEVGNVAGGSVGNALELSCSCWAGNKMSSSWMKSSDFGIVSSQFTESEEEMVKFIWN